MTAPNPYAAPQAPYAPPGAGAGAFQGPPGSMYVPLGMRTALVAISVFGMTLASFAMHGAQLAFADGPRIVDAGGPILDGGQIITGLVGLVVLFFSVACWVTIPVWAHRASSNLFGLGRYGMRFSPGWCAGWFFVPFANLVMPPQVMSELWKASDPELPQGSWFSSKGTGLIALWWATYLISGVGAWSAFFTKDMAVQGSIGLVETGIRAIAAVALVMIMGRIGKRQEQAAQRMGAGA
jgi:hypothetical protein